jgi:putative acetyltransferase
MPIEWRAKDDSDFLALISNLDVHCRNANGDRQAVFAPHNAVQQLSDVAVLTADGRAVACGALKPHEDGTVELKRVFVRPECRRHGYAQAILDALLARATEQGFHTMLLETNPGFTAAIALYRRNGFVEVDAFGPYVGLNTLCMGKRLR